jgi:Secretion system C-terminal sorting domain
LQNDVYITLVNDNHAGTSYASIAAYDESSIIIGSPQQMSGSYTTYHLTKEAHQIKSIRISQLGGYNDYNTLSFDTSLPVELTSFTGLLQDKNIILSWATATEVNNYGFDVERKTENVDWNKIGFVQGHGNSNSPKNYAFTDPNPPAGKIEYRLKQIDIDGKFKYSPVVDIQIETPSMLKLSQNFPNPFNPATVINYSIPAMGSAGAVPVQLKIFDLLGREVATLVNESKSPGNYEAKFDGTRFSSGVYFYSLHAGDFVQTKKMTLVK